MPTLSIITVNLNNKAGLQKTIDSVITQTCKDYEWIVIDGGSTDGSKELIEKYSSYITYWVSEPDSGIYNAMNKGVKKSMGDYLQFLNSGDCLYDENVVRDFTKRDNTEDVIYGNAVIVDDKGVVKSEFIAPEKIRLSYFWSHNLNHQATFFSKRCFDNYLYNEQNRIASDLELNMQLLLGGFYFAKWGGRFVVKFDNTGISSVNIKIGEFEGVVSHVLPECVKADYEEIIMFRDVDLAVMIKDIIRSKRIYRHITRLFLYPIYSLCKWTMKYQ